MAGWIGFGIDLAFGANGEGYLRLSFTSSMPNLQQATAQIRLYWLSFKGWQ